MEIWGVFGRSEIHRFSPLKGILEEFRPKPTSEEKVQRPINKSQVKSILSSLQARTTCQSVFTFTIAVCNGDRFLVDGQHRLAALRTLAEQFEDPEDREEFQTNTTVHIREILVGDLDEAVKLRDELGKARPVDAIGTLAGVRCQNLLHAFLHGCVNLPRPTTNPRYGNWSRDFENTVARWGFFTKFSSADEMIREVRELNTYLFDSVVRQNNVRIKEFITVGDRNKYDGTYFNQFREAYKLRNGDQVMCLALIVRYGFMEIILDKLQRKIQDYQTYFQEAIRNSLSLNFNSIPSREDEKEALRRFFGQPRVGEELSKPCPVCGGVDLIEDQSSTYHFGHIVARANGGTNRATNLIPVCPRCNLDCRAENMLEYCRRKFSRGFLL